MTKNLPGRRHTRARPLLIPYPHRPEARQPVLVTGTRQRADIIVCARIRRSIRPFVCPEIAQHINQSRPTEICMQLHVELIGPCT